MTETTHLPYTTSFYRAQMEGSLQSARAVLPYVFELINPESVVDIGCGVGPWLAVAKELGITEVKGYDGDYVDTSLLYIEPSEFESLDISVRQPFQERYDLAISLEVGEHIPADRAEDYVKNLTSLSDVILFSAAIPGQGGTHHINEQWPQYWTGLFQKEGYQVIDCLRFRFWNDDRVQYYYRQNMFIFVRQDALERYPALRNQLKNDQHQPLPIVHPLTLQITHREYQRQLRREKNKQKGIKNTFKNFLKAIKDRLTGKSLEKN